MADNPKELHSKAMIIAILMFLVFFVGVVATVIIPARTKEWSQKTAATHVYTPLQLRGREVYREQGCIWCHTQTNRHLQADNIRYGRYETPAPPSEGEEYINDNPHYLGNKRTGPDLSRIGGKYSDDWHHAHLRDPRGVVPGSIMVAFTWLYDAKGNPTPDAVALIAYLQSLGTTVPWAPPGDPNTNFSPRNVIIEGEEEL